MQRIKEIIVKTDVKMKRKLKLFTKNESLISNCEVNGIFVVIF